MANDGKINLPGGFGGLVRFNEEYESKFNITPTQVIVFVALILLFRLALPIIM